MIILRQRQIEFVERSIEALQKHGNTLGVAPTGAGKTIMLSAVISEMHKQNPSLKACVIAHRKELTEQNNNKFLKINQSFSTSVVNAKNKDWSGEVVFAMVQTLSKKRTLTTLPYLDLLVIDETHHVTSKSYMKIIKQARVVNPDVMIYGITATPQRGDKCSLGRVFTNCCDQIFLSELIESNHLVKPITYSVDVAQEKLKALKKKSAGDYDEKEVADILDQPVIIDEIIRHWREKAEKRKTVIFCSTIKHAQHVCIAFRGCGIRADLVTSELTKEQREFVLNQLTIGEIQVLINVAILTEGWDYPPISCVVLLRQSSFKSTMIQMIGRGLRVIDAAIYPDIIKKDCIVLDFGISTVLHGSLEQDVDLETEIIKKGLAEAKLKNCKACDRKIPIQTKKCPFCGYEHEKEIKDPILQVDVVLIDMLKKSEVPWFKLSENSFYSAIFSYWCFLTQVDHEWKVVAGKNNKENEEIEVVYKGDNYKRAIELGNSFLKQKEGIFRIQKNAELQDQPATDKQLQYIPKKYGCVSKGQAAVILSFEFNAKKRLQAVGLVA